MSRYVFLDTETTGLSPIHHDIWEIAYAVDEGPIHESFVTHNKNGMDPEALLLGHYERFATPAWLVEVNFEVDLRTALADATLVAANPSFDADFLRQRWGYWRNFPWKYRMLDIETYAMPALHLDEPKGLAYIAEQLGLIDRPNHTAGGDVSVLRDAFYKLRDYYDEKLGAL